MGSRIGCSDIRPSYRNPTLMFYFRSMSRHLDGSPKPVDPLWYRRHDGVLRAWCRCGHHAEVRLVEVERRHRLSPDMRVYQVVERLRCSRCGQRPRYAEVVRSGLAAMKSLAEPDGSATARQDGVGGAEELPDTAEP